MIEVVHQLLCRSGGLHQIIIIIFLSPSHSHSLFGHLQEPLNNIIIWKQTQIKKTKNIILALFPI